MTDLSFELDEGTGRVVVLLHEGAGSGGLWDRSRQGLLGGRRALSYDRRGYGRSPRGASTGPDHFDEAVADLRQLLDELTDGPVDLVGHSDGGSIALLAAARHPTMVRSVVAIATHVYADRQTVRGLRALGPIDSWSTGARQLYAAQHGPDWEQVVGGWLDMWTQGGLSDWDMRGGLPGIATPVFVIHDRQDPLSPPEHAELLEQGAPGVRISWSDTGSHRPHLVEPDRYAVELTGFWGSLDQ